MAVLVVVAVIGAGKVDSKNGGLMVLPPGTKVIRCLS